MFKNKQEKEFAILTVSYVFCAILFMLSPIIAYFLSQYSPYHYDQECDHFDEECWISTPSCQ